MKVTLLFLLVYFTGCGYTLGAQILFAPDAYNVNQDTDSKDEVEA